MQKKVLKKDGQVGTFYRLDFFMGSVKNIQTVKLKAKGKSASRSNGPVKNKGRCKTKQV